MTSKPIDKDHAISVFGLSKCYSVYARPQDRLKQMAVPRVQRLLGREQTSYFREIWALRAATFDVMRGETVGIVHCYSLYVERLTQVKVMFS
jgi:lipopolysaccharide transport system ATP-binding protein